MLFLCCILTPPLEGFHLSGYNITWVESYFFVCLKESTDEQDPNENPLGGDGWGRGTQLSERLSRDLSFFYITESSQPYE